MLSTYLVARRDYLGYVTAWGFWLGLLLTPVLLGIGILAPSLAASSQPTRYFTIIETGDEFTKAIRSELDSIAAELARTSLDPVATLQGEESERQQLFDEARQSGATTQEALDAAGGAPIELTLGDFVEVPPPARTAEALKPYLLGQQLIDTPEGPKPLFAALVVSEDGETIEYWSENLQSRALMDISRAAERKIAEERIFTAAGVSSRLLDDARDARRDVVAQRARPTSDAASSEVTLSDQAPFIVSIAMAFALWFLIFSVINYLLMGTIEERSNKIFDSLLTSVSLPSLLAGKLLAVLALALTLMAFWGIGSAAIGMFASQQLSPDFANNALTVLGAALHPSLIVPAVISFILGYLMYGSLFLALGSLCDTIQEAQTLMTPLIVLLMVPLFMLTFAISDAQSPIIEAMVWIPVFTPFLLILRMPTDPPMIEVFAQLGLMAVAAALILYLATRVYRAGAVHGAGVADVWAFFGKLIPGRKAES
ncbi:MAG: ABC transporter permease [Henriciella sp.]|nr:ABC transporter permease [Henriciella sp.]